MDLTFNASAHFTRWIIDGGALHEPFVVVDIGVQGGENPRWHLLGDHLIVHGFDAIEEVVETLRRQNAGNPTRQYHFIAAGDVDEERAFFFNSVDPCSSSFFRPGDDRFSADGTRLQQLRKVKMRRLDTLLAEGAIPKADFLKIDVEGFEKFVLLGAEAFLDSVLGMECETNFGVSPTYPDSHLGTVQRLLLKNHLLIFDLNSIAFPVPPSRRRWRARVCRLFWTSEASAVRPRSMCSFAATSSTMQITQKTTRPHRHLAAPIASSR